MLSRAFLFLLTLMAALSAGCGKSEPEQKPPTAQAGPVTLTVIVPEAVTGGETFLLGWRFDLSAGWHLYWNGRNDSGFAPTVKHDLPTGWQAGPLLWPVPERHLAAGDILDHVYHGQLLLLQEVTVPAGAPLGPVNTTARVDWLACRDECVPGHADRSWQVRVAENSVPGAGAALLAGAREGLPRPAPQAAVTFAWTADSVTVTVPGAAGLEFFPDADCGRLTDLIADGQGRTDRLVLRLRPEDGRIGPLKGILRRELPDGSWQAWTIDAQSGG